MNVPLLSVDDLAVEFATRNGRVQALRGVSLAVSPGETLGVVGESGSGKSVTAFATMGLLERAGRITAGRIVFRGENITAAPRSVMQPLRGAAMSMIFQNPRAALNPIRSVGLQIADALRAHRPLSLSAATAAALELLKAVRIRDPEKRLHAYPHELSGGMCQRVMISIALACEPALLIADEPTTGLDVTTQKTVMDIVTKLTRERDMAMILITHDLGLAAQYCDRIAVMEQGQVVETADPSRLFSQPQHGYTRRLVAASPRRGSTVASLVVDATMPAAKMAPPPMRKPGAGPLLDIRNLVKLFPGGVTAVNDVSFRIGAGESLGLVGESGSGKSTISRLVCRLMNQTSGEIIFDGEDIGAIPERDFHRCALRRDIQIVFQDPSDSLNPRFTAFDSIVDPLRRLLGESGATALRARAREIATRVGLPIDLLDRFPHQLSGGQKARVGIARAIAVDPRLLILDEPTAALDVSVQAVVLHLLDRLRRESGLAFLFVSHDLNVVRMMCERLVVLQNGAIVEHGVSQAIFDEPQTDYARELLAAIPHFDPEARA